MPKHKTPKEKRRAKYSTQFNDGTLKKNVFDLLNKKDRVEYITLKVREKYPTANNPQKFIGGKYSCMYCAIADIFETGGYISETDD